MEKLYIKTTLDNLELPETVTESPQELAEMIGTTSGSVLSAISHKNKGWYRVEVEEDND